jgi:hypothetical protein
MPGMFLNLQNLIKIWPLISYAKSEMVNSILFLGFKLIIDTHIGGLTNWEHAKIQQKYDNLSMYKKDKTNLLYILYSLKMSKCKTTTLKGLGKFRFQI